MRRDQVSPRASPQPISLAAGAPSSSSSRCPSRCVSDVAFNVCREGSRFPFPRKAGADEDRKPKSAPAFLASSPDLPRRERHRGSGGREAAPVYGADAPSDPPQLHALSTRLLEALSGPYRAQAQRGDPSDMQSVAGRRSEAGEVCHSGAWREERRRRTIYRSPDERGL